MQPIPILFLEDDDQLIEMYREFLATRGYHSILIRNGQQGLEQAMETGPSLITLKASTIIHNRHDRSLPVIIITHSRNQTSKGYKIKPALISSEIFSALKEAIGK